jgi:hypothetical protein
MVKKLGRPRKSTTKRPIDRFQKAHHLAKMSMVKVNKRDGKNRITDAFVAGSEAKTYDVILRRYNPNVIETECLLDTGAGGQHCKGGTRAVCYHALATIIFSAIENKLEASICQTYADAERRQRIGGKIYVLLSRYAKDNRLWLVVNVPVDERHQDGVDTHSLVVEQMNAEVDKTIFTEANENESDTRDGLTIDRELGFD